MFRKYFFSLTLRILGLSIFAVNGQEIPTESNKVYVSIQKRAAQLLQDKRFHSVSIGVYFQGQTYAGHFGELEIGMANTPDNNTLYEIGSVSKTMTGLVTAQAVLDGKLALDSDINRYLDNTLLNLSPASKPITIRDILTHHSGIPHNLADLSPNLDRSNASRDVFLDALNHPALKKTPGQFQYSNIAPELLAHILEIVYEQPFEQLLKNTLMAKAEMENTMITMSDTDFAHFAYGYNETGQKMPALTDKPKLWGAGGQVKSTMPDILKYMALQLGQLDPAVKESQKRLTPDTSLARLGYFWQQQTNQEGTYLQHHGGLYGTQNWLILYPSYDIGISVISNVSFDGVSNGLREVADSIVDDIKLSGAKSIRLAIQRLCIENVEACLAQYHSLKATKKATYSFGDKNELNNLGYKLLGLGKLDTAIQIFQLQVTEFPDQSNPYDSLAEAFYMKKDYSNALKNYRTSLLLDKNNVNAQSMIERIKSLMRSKQQ